MKEFFQPEAYTVRGIKNHANIYFCAPTALSVSGTSAGAMRMYAPPSIGQQALTAVCRQASSALAMSGGKSWVRYPACGVYSAVPVNHILYRPAKPRAVFSAFPAYRSEYQRHPIIPQPDPFHLLKLRFILRTAAFRLSRQGLELSALFLYIRSRRHLRRLFRLRMNRRPMHDPIRIMSESPAMPHRHERISAHVPSSSHFPGRS